MKTVSLFRFSLLLAAVCLFAPVPNCLPEVQRTGPLRTVPAIPARAEWKHFRILVWPWQTDVRKDYPLYEKLGLGGFQIDRGAGQEEKTGFSLTHDFPYYAGHIADKGFLYLTGKNRDAVTGRKDLLIRPRSLADPETIAQMKAHMDKNIRAAKKGLVLTYAFDDEISLGTFTNPADLDIHPLSLDWFREWLKKEYGTVNALNRQWNTAYRDFAEVMPQGFEQIRKNLTPGQPGQWNLSPWMDFRHFMDFQFAAVLAELTRHANGIDPKTPAGFAGAQAPSPWGGYDYAMLCRSVQWMEAYDIHETNEILRSFWNRDKRPSMQTFFSSGDLKTDSWFLWYSLVHGNQAAIAWPEAWFPAEKGQISPHILNLRETFQQVQGEISQHILHPDTVSAPDPIGIYYSHPSVQAGWVTDAAVHRGTWHRRMTSLDNDNQSGGILRTVWCKTLEDLGYQYDFVSYLDVQEKKTDLNRLFKVIILPKIICLSDAEADALKDFV
ncbi:MAG: beta-galactosidase, partial [Desulfobacterales bacterium]